jgi:asparagine synthase (glutamine-hydrolysing)
VCGICGLATAGGEGIDPEELAAMNAALVHRGPDADGSFREGPIGLAMRRLSIVDLAGGDQPLTSEDGRVVVIGNGEILNHAELRAGLERSGHSFATRSDVEVVVHLYEERGPAFAEALRGMFAVAVWDRREQRLVLARDPFGIKPLYWSEDARGGLAFASELGALERRPGFRRTVDLDALEGFLAFNSVPAPYSIYAGVRKLEPGHRLEWRPGTGAEVRRYSRPAPVPLAELRAEPEAVLAEELLGRLRDSVRAHLMADVPVGVLLSGGVDSGALTALAAQESAHRISTFSVGFAEASFDELGTARQVAGRYGTDHHELVLRPDVAALLSDVADAYDEPFADSSALPTFMVSRLAAEHVKVVLSGEGADELFGGYYTYVADRLAPRIGGAAARLAPLVERLPSSNARASFDYRAKRFVRAAARPPLEAHCGWKEIFSPDARAELLDRAAGSAAPADPMDGYRARYAETAGAEPLARLQDVDLGLYLVDDLLVKTDRASMAHSLEARVPFLDPVVAELAHALPARSRVRGLAKKRLLRRAVAPLLPDAVVNGRKRGFSIPAAAWLRGELEPMARDLLAPEALRRDGWFDPAAVTRLLDRHVAAQEDHSRQLWGLLSFTLWRQRTRPAPPAVGQTAAGSPSWA